MAQVLRELRQTITRWPYEGSNGFGGFSFGAPVTMRGRWEDRTELFTTPQGREVVSRAVIYLEKDVEVGDYVAQGDHSSELDPIAAGGYQVERFDRITDLRGLRTIRKAFA